MLTRRLLKEIEGLKSAEASAVSAVGGLRWI
jgi:hypothetical protein